MDDQVSRFQELGRLVQAHGLEMIFSLSILILGLMLTKWAASRLKTVLGKFFTNPAVPSMISSSTAVLLLGVTITLAAMEMGGKPGTLVALMMIIMLCVIGVIVTCRPLIPSLPFKVGDTVKVGDLLGKIEATTILNTRLRTFDGKTFFVPNRKILDDIVINYHYTKTRRIKIDVTIGYDQDLLKAKQTLEALMIEDARVQPKPNPQVYVLELGPNGVLLGGRCWVENEKFWVTKCELLEKTKLRFDQEGIRVAHNRLDVCYRPLKPTETRELLEEDA